MGVNENTATPVPNPQAEEPIVASRRRSSRPTRSPEETETAGFTPQWSSTTNERAARRHTEVQANIAGNPNRPEYRTVTTGQPENEPHFIEMEESMFTRCSTGRKSLY